MRNTSQENYHEKILQRLWGHKAPGREDKMRIWSVELETNSWNNDIFNGTFEECVEYCRENDYTIDGIHARLAEIEVDEDGCWTYCYDIVEEL